MYRTRLNRALELSDRDLDSVTGGGFRLGDRPVPMPEGPQPKPMPIPEGPKPMPMPEGPKPMPIPEGPKYWW